MEQFELFCRILGWIVIGGCSLCILFSIIGLFYLLIKKLIMKSTDWDAIAKRHKKSQEALNYMAEHPLTHDEAVQQGIKLKNMSLEDEIKRYTEERYHETFGNGQGTLDDFDWEDISTVIEDTARHFYNLRPSWKPSEEQMLNLKKAYESYDFCDGERKALESLYEQLKDLM